jgi:hypothetical protein
LKNVVFRTRTRTRIGYRTRICATQHLIKLDALKQSPTPFLQQLFFVPILFGTYFLYAVGFYLSPPIINGITIKLVIEMMNFKVWVI